jgi:hypothetical protein
MSHAFPDQRTIAEGIHTEAIAALSVTRDNAVEITSSRQLKIIEEASWRILAMRLPDEQINDAARALRERATAAARWTWVDVPAAVALTVLALLVGIGTAASGGIVLAVIGGLASSGLLIFVILRYRRENWRIRAEQIAPMILRPGV